MTNVTFTAIPHVGYEVDQWIISVGSFETGTGTSGNTTAKVRVMRDTVIQVLFKEVPGSGNLFNSVTGQGIVGKADFKMVAISDVQDVLIGRSGQYGNQPHTVSHDRRN